MAARAFLFTRRNGRAPFTEYVQSLTDARQIGSIKAVVDKLIQHNGRLPRPYSAHVEGKLWELRTRHGNRAFYFIESGPDIILLDGYTKKRDRIEPRILEHIRSLHAEYLIIRNRTPYHPHG
jgi:putative component of toxin-antitoxin plasmid stabilization module